MERVTHLIQLNVLLGAWLIAAPFVLGYAGSRTEMSNDVAVGIVSLLVSAMALWMSAARSKRPA